MTLRRAFTALTAAGVAAASLTGATPASAGGNHHPGKPLAFDRVATYPVFQNRPAGEDPTSPTVAEISAVSEDGRTLVYTDALGRRIGFLDISRADKPRGLGTLSLSQLGDAEDEPTSVAVVGRYVLVVVNTSRSYTEPSGRLDVVELVTRKRVRSFDLGGQPDSIAISKDHRYAAIAIENERDEEATPPGGEEGDLPQLPGGFVQIVDLAGANPAGWRVRP
ncbi:alkaline phosphatase, partial [Micromonospora azadirachtae]